MTELEILLASSKRRWNMTYIDEKLYDSWLTEMVKRLVTSSTSSSNWIFEMLVSTDDDVYCISLIHNGLDLDFYFLVQYLTISIITKLKFSLKKLALVKSWSNVESNLKHIQFLKHWMYLFHFMHLIWLNVSIIEKFVNNLQCELHFIS